MWERSFSQVSEGMFIVDKEFKVLQCNEAFSQIIGESRDGVIGKHCYNIVHGLGEASDSCVTCSAIKRCVGVRADMYEPFLDKYIEVAADPVLDDDGELIFAVHTLMDITEKVKLIEKEKELAAAEAAVAAAEQHSEQLRTIINLAAHELRHPATIFKAYSNLLLERGGQLDDEAVRDALRAIDKAADRLTNIVTKLRDTSSITHERLELQFVAVLPSSIVTGAVDRIRGDNPQRDFTISLPDNEEAMIADPEKLSAALTMLLENAVIFSPDDSAVEVSLQQSEDHVVIEVSDRGEGVPEEDRELVFERFYQVVDLMHHSKPGMGMGLFIAKEIVVAHGGWIKNDPRTGGGSVFSMGIPARQEPS